MAEFKATVYLERLGKPYVVMRQYPFTIPDSDLEGLRGRDYYVYARVRRVEDHVKP